MVNDPNSIVEEWRKNPLRPIMLIDETREDDGPKIGQYVLFICILTNAMHIVNCLCEAELARLELQGYAKDINFKGRLLFGKRGKKSHEIIRSYVVSNISKVESIVVLASSSKAIRNCYSNMSGGINAISSTEQRKMRVFGPELPLLLNYVKKIAIDRMLKSIQVDVIVDRSQQFGLGVRQRSLKKRTFEVLGPGTLNRVAGDSFASSHCPSKFYIIASSDNGTFRDLLLLPDAIGYIGAKNGYFDDMKQNILKGDLT